MDGNKLKIARLLAGYSITELAEKIGITKQSLSQYESGSLPRPDVYFKLINILNCSNEFLNNSFESNIEVKNTFFRALNATTASARKNQEIKTELVIRLYRYFLKYLDLPNLNLPKLNESLSIKEKAIELRKFWKLGNAPIKNLIQYLEMNGIIVSTFNAIYKEDISYKIDGYTCQYKDDDFTDRFCVIVENNKDSLARKNFSLAHELGHIILHTNEEYELMSKQQQNQLEKEANEFASEFLLPEAEYKKDAKYATTLHDFVILKSKWNVSIGAMMLRSRNLKCITDEQYLKLIKLYSFHKYRHKEPLDDPNYIFKPILFQKSIEILFDNGFTLERFESELAQDGLSLSLSQIEDLLGLEQGFFNKYKNPLDTITLKLSI